MAIAGIWQWMSPRSAPVAAAILLGVMIFASAKRAHEWHDLERLMAGVLQQYPTNARAIWVLQRKDIEAGNWQAVIDRHTKDFPRVTLRFHEKNRMLMPLRELPTGHHALAEVGCMGFFARAVAELHGAEQGMQVIDALERGMRQLRLDPQAHLDHWQHFSRAKAWMLHRQGRNEEAYELLRDIAMADSRLLLKEIERTLGKPASPAATR
jgi:hypothetical protein